MSLLTGVPSLYDERSWRSDSAYQSSLYKVRVGQLSYGEFDYFDISDWYLLDVTSPGTYTLTISNDSRNNYSSTNSWGTAGVGIRAEIVDYFGLSLSGVSTTTARGSLDGTITFTVSAANTSFTSELYVKVNDYETAGLDYVLTLSAATPTAPANQVITGTAVDDTLIGSAGNDTIYGLAGNDLLRGGAGNDTLDGGTGLDIASYVDAAFGVAVDLTNGVSSGGAGTDKLVSIEDVFGSPYGDAITGSAVSNYLTSSDGNDVILGLAGNDFILGDGGNDSLIGGDGNDQITGGAGNDDISGGAGIDTSIYGGSKANYIITRDNPAVWAINAKTGTDGIDRLDYVERLKFSDSYLAIDTATDGHAGQTAQIVRALFGPSMLANKEIVGIGMYFLDQGTAFNDLVAMAIGTGDFAALAGSRSNTDFVKLVYKNVVGVAPPKADLDAYVGLLDSGAYTQNSLGVLACQTAVNTESIDLVGIASHGIEFVPFMG